MSVALYCSATDLRLLVGSASAKQVRIEQFLSVPLPEGAMLNGIITSKDTMTRFLTEVQDQFGAFKMDAVLCVESNLVRSRLLTVPNVPEQQMLRFVTESLGTGAAGSPGGTGSAGAGAGGGMGGGTPGASGTSSTPGSGAAGGAGAGAGADAESDDVFDFALLGSNRTKGGVDVLGIAAGRALLAAYKEVFEDAGFRLRRIDVGTNALIKIASHSPHLMDDNDLLALIDGQMLFLVLFEQGRFILMKKYRLISAPGTDESRREVGNHVSTFVQFQKTQQSEADIHAVHFAGVSSERIEAFKAHATYLQMPILNFTINDKLKLVGKAAFNQENFEVDKYLFNIGTLMGR